MSSFKKRIYNEQGEIVGIDSSWAQEKIMNLTLFLMHCIWIDATKWDINLLTYTNYT